MANLTAGLAVIFAVFGLLCGNLIGGWFDGDVNDVKVTKFASQAVSTLDAKSNSLFSFRLGKIISVKTQVVAGVNYRIVFTIEQTDCRKQDKVDDLGSCQAQAEQVCKLDVYERSWENFLSIKEPICSELESVKSRQVRSVRMLGGAEDVEIRDKTVLAAVDYIMEDINMRRNSMYRTMPVDLMDVTKQVVSGLKYRFTLIMGESPCRNNDKNRHAKLHECPVDRVQGKLEKCKVEVAYQAWSDAKFTVNTMDCRPAKTNPSKILTTSQLDPKMNHIPVIGGDGHDNAHLGVFQQFERTYNKTYKNQQERLKRFQIFRENMKKVDLLNDNELADATYGVTQFADLSEEEFRRYYLTPKWDLTHRSNLKQADIPDVDPPAAFDWRDHNAVTPVKNQGMCGSCWAFSTTGNVEGQWAVHKNKLVSLSEQELVDCDKLDDGCEGGLPVNAYEEIMRLGGLESEKKYPYDGADEKCKFAVGDVAVYINGSVNISSNEAEMAAWLYKNGPISIGINAFAMQFYMGGVSHPFSFLCSPDELDHGVLIVGYGTKQGWFSENPYWIVKNSWGSSWGEKGYYLVYRGDGVCGLNKMPTSSIVK